MTIERAAIELKNFHVYAYIGVLEQERTVGNRYCVNLTVEYPLGRSMETDQLSDTINYARVAALVEETLGCSCNLLEHAAGRVAQSIFQTFPQATLVDIELVKENPPMSGQIEAAGVHLVIRP